MTSLLNKQRIATLHCMQLLHVFRPKLATELDCTDIEHYDPIIKLHCFCDCVEDIYIFLLNQHIEPETTDITLRINRHKKQNFTAFQFLFAQHSIQTIAFTERYHHIRPKQDHSPYGTIHRASLATVASLVPQHD